jgi:predicted house-cleaning NTP pyrophosphatase (Maf/HAM1 superfamily)
MLPIIEGIPAVERESWKKQETEARAYIADSAAPTPLIDALAASRGVDKADLVSRIIVKADLFATISGQLIGKRQALEDAVNALSDKATADDVAAISW